MPVVTSTTMRTLTRTTAMVTSRRAMRTMTKTTEMPAIGSLHCPASYYRYLPAQTQSEGRYGQKWKSMFLEGYLNVILS